MKGIYSCRESISHFFTASTQNCATKVCYKKYQNMKSLHCPQSVTLDDIYMCVLSVLCMEVGKGVFYPVLNLMIYIIQGLSQ